MARRIVYQGRIRRDLEGSHDHTAYRACCLSWVRLGALLALACLTMFPAAYVIADRVNLGVQAWARRGPSQPGAFTNPVLDRDFPDPDVLVVGDRYYAFSTSTRAQDRRWLNVQVAVSSDLVRWEAVGDALPVLPSWARQKSHFVWAPEVSARANGGGYLLYFVARDKDSDRQCIGTATATTPEGPFTALGTRPVICQVDEGGSIDPSSFVDDDGTHYLLWKSEGRGGSGRREPWIYLQRLATDGLTPDGPPVRLIGVDRAWEGPIIEAPTLWKRNGRYYLFYSGNRYTTDRYGVGYAVAEKPTGPYTKPVDGPLLSSRRSASGDIIGPGGQDIVAGRDGRTWMVYHAWDQAQQYRRLNIDPLVWENDVPHVLGATRAPQAMP